MWLYSIATYISVYNNKHSVIRITRPCHLVTRFLEGHLNVGEMVTASCDWTNFGKPTKLSHMANSGLSLHLIATLMHYPCTVSLPAIASWPAFLEQNFAERYRVDVITGNENIGPMEGTK